jgi:hypothetical protein
VLTKKKDSVAEVQVEIIVAVVVWLRVEISNVINAVREGIMREIVAVVSAVREEVVETVIVEDVEIRRVVARAHVVVVVIMIASDALIRRQSHRVETKAAAETAVIAVTLVERNQKKKGKIFL